MTKQSSVQQNPSKPKTAAAWHTVFEILGWKSDKCHESLKRDRSLGHTRVVRSFTLKVPTSAADLSPNERLHIFAQDPFAICSLLYPCHLVLEEPSKCLSKTVPNITYPSLIRRYVQAPQPPQATVYHMDLRVLTCFDVALQVWGPQQLWKADQRSKGLRSPWSRPPLLLPRLFQHRGWVPCQHDRLPHPGILFTACSVYNRLCRWHAGKVICSCRISGLTRISG